MHADPHVINQTSVRGYTYFSLSLETADTMQIAKATLLSNVVMLFSKLQSLVDRRHTHTLPSYSILIHFPNFIIIECVFLFLNYVDSCALGAVWKQEKDKSYSIS